MELLRTVLLAFWVLLPAYLPNNVAVLAGGGRPIDGGRSWRGRRLLGDGKTWRGSGAGVAAGIIAAVALNAIHPLVTATTGLELPTFSWPIVLAFPLGAILGDITASFVKRRSGRQRGAPFPLVDQLDFLVMALIVGLLLDPAWITSVFSPLVVAVAVGLTLVLHVGTNVLAYGLGLKDEPW